MTTIETPEMKKVLARDVLPFHWGVWCTVGDDRRPFTNPIEHAKWSEDGQHLWFMLGSFNFLKAAPDEELELVPRVPAEWLDLEKIKREHRELMAQRPVPVQPTAPCATCAGTGRVLLPGGDT